MKAAAKKTTDAKQRLNRVSAFATSAGRPARKERILVEFPSRLLRRTEEAARKLEKNRSELVRTAVEQLLNNLDAAEFERELAAAYTANDGVAREMLKEFEAVDREGF